MRPSVTPSDPLSENRTGDQLEAVSRSESFCCLEIGRYDQAENNPSIRRSVVTLKPAERVIGIEFQARHLIAERIGEGGEDGQLEREQ